ncbi:hypothetical protein BHE74_00024306, partial [Ensete ventricosum]
WKLARSASGACRGYQKFVRMAQGSLPEKDRDSRSLSGVAEKLAGRLIMRVAMESQPDDGPRSSLSIRPRFGRCSGISRSSLRDSPKGSGSSLGTRREIVERRPDDLPQGCRRLLDWWELGLDYLDWSLSVVIIES